MVKDHLEKVPGLFSGQSSSEQKILMKINPAPFLNGGARRDRTADPLLAKQVLSQLSYGPSLVYFSPGRVAARRSFGHVLMYAPSLTPRVPCQSKNILREVIKSFPRIFLAQYPRLCRSFDRRPAAYYQYVRGGDRTRCAILVGLGRFELPTSPLSGVRSNQLSYRPESVTQQVRSNRRAKLPDKARNQLWKISNL